MMRIPVMGFGTYSPENDRKTTENAVKLALKMGYRHFDTAQIYGSEPALGNAINRAMSRGVIEREDVFITSKLWGSNHHDPVSALHHTLMNLGLEYLDMYLVHWPVRFKPWTFNPLPDEEDFEELDLETTWAGMERCLELGLCKGIGVSNFSCKKIESLLDHASVPPAINQVEMHPMWRQSKMREYCEENKIHVSGYSGLGGPGNYWGSTAVVHHPTLHSIALKHRATPAQVAIRWGMSMGASIIVKSFNKARMKENIGALDLELDDDDLLEIEMMEQRKIMRGEVYVNHSTSPYRTIHELWDDEI